MKSLMKEDDMKKTLQVSLSLSSSKSRATLPR